MSDFDKWWNSKRVARHPEIDAPTCNFIKRLCKEVFGYAAQPRWRPIETAPKTYEPVMLFFRTKKGLPVTVVAYWIAEFSEQSSEDFAEYDPDTDEYYCPEGWYEQQWFNYEYAYILMDEEPTHWMPLPPPPEQEQCPPTRLSTT